MGPEYLFSVPLHIFYYYVKIFNKREKQREIEEKQAMNEQGGGGEETPNMVGNTIPRPG